MLSWYCLHAAVCCSCRKRCITFGSVVVPPFRLAWRACAITRYGHLSSAHRSYTHLQHIHIRHFDRALASYHLPPPPLSRCRPPCSLLRFLIIALQWQTCRYFCMSDMNSLCLVPKSPPDPSLVPCFCFAAIGLAREVCEAASRV